MRYGFRLLFLSALGVAASVFAARAGDGDRVTFDTVDGVTLDGTFFKAAPKEGVKDKNATVLILHNVSKTSGGNSHQDGWDDLASKLSDAGYSVLSFDFRGFGHSHNVSKDFWDPVKGKYNLLYIKGGSRAPETIDFKDFESDAGKYYPYLVNDVVAAKAFLDRQTDRGLANSSNLVLVGAGEGATVGAMWMASQWHLKKLNGIDRVTGKLTLDEPEGRDEAGALWLSISPELGGHGMSQTARNCLVDTAADNNVPMAFLYGAKDSTSASMAKEALQNIANRVRRDNPNLKEDALKEKVNTLAAVKAIPDSKAAGSALLSADGITDAIVKSVGQLIDKRGPKEARAHAVRPEDIYYWTFPNMRPQIAKTDIDQIIESVPMSAFLNAFAGG
jgi:alpha-beta hydrolase superfamily lysophospholipase